MGTNMYPSSALLGQDKDSSISALPVDELIEKADGFAGVFPGMPLLRTYASPKCHVRQVLFKLSNTLKFLHFSPFYLCLIL